jgi:hypothetical protein
MAKLTIKQKKQISQILNDLHKVNNFINKDKFLFCSPGSNYLTGDNIYSNNKGEKIGIMNKHCGSDLQLLSTQITNLQYFLNNNV